MIMRLDNYKLGPKLVCYSDSDSTTQMMLSKDLECLQIQEAHLVHYPSGITLKTGNDLGDALSLCERFDVLEIDEKGRVFSCFSNRSTDNTIVVTGRCNSSCIMCPDSDKARASSVTRTLESLLNLVRYIPSDARHLTITGGEPFLLGWDIFTFLKAAKEKFTNTDFLLLTNGRIFAVPKYCAELKRSLPSKTTIGIPIHGYDASSHDNITQVDGSFRQTLSGIKRLISMGMSIELRIVVSRVSSKHLDKIAQLIVSDMPGTKCVKIVGLEMLGNAAKNSELVWLPYPEAFAKCRSAVSRLIENGIDVGLYNFPLCSVNRDYWPICEKSISDYKIRYLDECSECCVRNACGGIFAGTRRLAAQDVRAIRGPGI